MPMHKEREREKELERERLTVKYLYPSTEMIPAVVPKSMAPQGWIGMWAEVPTATPPAKVAF